MLRAALILILVFMPAQASAQDEGAAGEVGTQEIAALPSGWALAGSPGSDYQAGLDPEHGRGGSSSAILWATKPYPKGYVAILQSVESGGFAEGRWRLSAWVRCDAGGLRNEVGGEFSAGLWLRVDGEEERGLAFDNMEKQPIRTCEGWQQHQITFEVPAGATTLMFGAWLRGAATFWVDDFAFDHASATESLTTWPLPTSSRLDFEDADQR